MRKQSKSSTKQLRADVYERITNRIIEQLEQGTRPWMQPWGACGTPVRPLRHNGVPYRGINTVLLWMEASERGYSSPFWMTYKQAQELGGQVRKGEKSALVVYANAIERTETTESGEEIEKRIPFMKGYSVLRRSNRRPARAVLRQGDRARRIGEEGTHSACGCLFHQPWR